MARDPKGGELPPRLHTPFADLPRRLGMAPAPPAPSPGPGAPANSPPPPARAVVRMERKGRGGKTATVVEQLGLPPARLEAWLLDLKRALGCGGTVEGAALVLQGDLRERVAALLAARGVKKVVKG